MVPKARLSGAVAMAFACVMTWGSAALAADVILNEYNGVDNDTCLDAFGEPVIEPLACASGAKSDSFWGTRLGNGGDWFELVVISDHLDMRDWTFEVVNDAIDAPESWEITLTSDPVWSDVRRGTIITVSEDLRNNLGDYEPAAGRWWMNVRADSGTSGTFATVACLSPVCLPQDANWKVSNNDSQITIKDDLGGVVFGPAGEGETPTGGVSSLEVLKLEEDPTATVTESSGYSDGESSTFGSANVWSSGAQSQDLSTLRSAVPYSPLTDVVINEVLSHSDPGVDWVELYNTTTSAIDVGGWFLSDTFNDLTKYEIPAATEVPALGYLVIDETELSFGFSSACGDEVILSQGNGVSVTGPRDFAEFGPMDTGVTLGRYPNAAGPFVRMTQATQGAGNALPQVGPVVINEVMYHPELPEPPPSVDPEFVELHNTSAATVTLAEDYGASGVHPWRLRGGVDFDFSTTQTIDPGEYLLVVNFDPVGEPVKDAEFRAFYSIGASVELVGPYSGSLNNFSENVRLRRPDTPEANPGGTLCGSLDDPYVPSVLLDEIIYFDHGEWPSEADGGGPSLERREVNWIADDATNWAQSSIFGPTPGSTNSTQPPFTAAQQKCINTLNKDYAKVVKTQGKEVSRCIKDASRDSLDGITADECLTADRRGKVAKTELKTGKDFTKTCTGTDSGVISKLPGVAATDADTVNGAAVDLDTRVVRKAFTPQIAPWIILSDDDRDGAKCQDSVVKNVFKCVDTHVKEFLSCKKVVLKGPVSSSADIAACVGSDPKNKIFKACDASTSKVRTTLDSRCVGEGVALDTAFPGCGSTAAADVATCLQQAAGCQACLGANVADGLFADCDIADDGVDNNSCP